MNCACVFQWAWGGPVAGNCFAFHMVMLLELSWALNSGFATRGNVKTILEKKTSYLTVEFHHDMLSS